MRTTLILTAISIATVTTTAATPSGDDCVKGTGAVVKRTLEVGAFHGIVLQGSMDVVLTQAPVQSVEVEAQANLIELLETSVRNGVWEVSTRDGYSTDKAFIVHISVPVIDRVAIEGSGDVTTNGTFAADGMELSIDGSGNLAIAFSARRASAAIAGSGDMLLSGTCTDLTVSVAGSGDVNAKALKTANAEVGIAGSGDVSLDASQSLEASIAGSGDINYRGKPAHVSKNVMGSGDVRALDHGPH